ncbi:MAG: ATP-binding protein [Daejeonella sp.]
MKWSLQRLLSSFRSKILFSFLAFASILLLWLGIYQWINYKEKEVQKFNMDLSIAHNRYMESNKALEYFIVKGYHEPGFYINGKQTEMDQFLAMQKECVQKLELLLNQSYGRSMGLEKYLSNLIKLSHELAASARELKHVYFNKGFKDYGWEGKMRKYAHIIEDSSMVPEKDILMLRRHEKDFLIRGEASYANAFYKKANDLLSFYPFGSNAHSTLTLYKSSFSEFEKYSNRLGIYRNNGKYQEVQELVSKTSNMYVLTQTHTQHYISNLQDTFKQILVAVSVAMIAFAVFLSLVLSKILTRDITELNRRMLSFIRSRFKEFNDDEPEDGFNPRINEVYQLNRQFVLLKKNLKNTLEELEDAVFMAQKASDYKSTFLANMSHEIRTPLNGIIGMLYILKDTSLTNEQENYLETMEFSATHLMDVLNMILDYSKIEAGKVELERIPFDLKKDVSKVMRIFNNLGREKGLTLTLNYGLGHVFMEIGDPLRIQQILINLLNNAMKFTDQGTISLHVIGNKIAPETIRTRFEVHDTGIGIREERLKDLFKAFKQGDSSTTRNYGGTGLGLTIAYELVTLMGGELSATSTLGKGSVFYFEIDLPVSKRLKERLPLKSIHQKRPMSMNVLLAEDNAINQKVMEMMLKKMGHTVEIAADGQEACLLFEKNFYDIILMDVQMPVMDGMKATIYIKNTEQYKSRPIPVIAVTANAFDEDREKAYRAGMDDFLTKPVKPVELENMFLKFNPRQLSPSGR